LACAFRSSFWFLRWEIVLMCASGNDGLNDR
jgi:hypothetical protein